MRNHTLDVARGVAFLCMMAHHVFTFTRLAQPGGGLGTRLPPFVARCGAVARHLFIVIAGYALALQFQVRPDTARTWRTRARRGLEVGLHAAAISLVTYLCYPDRWVRFGILHFMCVASLLASTLLLSPHHEWLALCVVVGLCNAPVTGTWVDVVSGADPRHAMLDWFPLVSWFPWLWLGVMLGKYVPIPSIPTATTHRNAVLSGLSVLGQNSLALYTAHFVLFCAAARYGRAVA